MTVALERIRDGAGRDACTTGRSITPPLTAKGVSLRLDHGAAAQRARRAATASTPRAWSASSTDLVVRPFQWKGSVASIRDFNRDASHNELGMQAVELVGDGLDGDGDRSSTR